jgi:ribosome maturation factor RimP
MDDGLENRLQSLAERACMACGVELYHLEFHGGRHGLLRVYIEKPGGAAVSHEDCRMMSQQLGALLDVEDPIASSYTLEVSSPGLDRELFTPEHYRRAQGRLAAVKTFAPVEGGRYFEGRITEAGPEDFALEAGGRLLRLAYANVAKGRLRLEELPSKTKGGRKKTT